MNPALRGGVRRDLLLVGLVALVLFCAGLGARDLWNPNEPLYGQAVREMVESGSWTRATVNGLAFDEKPILYFWLARLAALALGGVNELTLRLPAALSGVATVLLTYVLVLPYSGRRQATIAALMVSTTFVVYWSAHRVQMDLTLTACTVAALIPLSRWLDHGARAGRSWLIAGAAVGLGLLAKGPVGLICPIAPFAIVCLLRGRTRPRIPAAAFVAGAAGLLIVAAPWYIALALDGGAAALGELLWRQNVERFVDPWDHQAPWWYFLRYLWIDFTPWVWLLPLALALPCDDEPEARLRRLAWVWLLATLVFFSLSASKRSPYIMPAAPAAAILAASVATRWLDGRLERRRAMLLHGVALVWGLLFVGAALAVVRLAPKALAAHHELVPSARLGAALFAAAGAAVLFAWLVPGRRRAARAIVLFAAIASIEGVAALQLLPAANPLKSHRALCAEINRHAPLDRPLVGYRLWRWRAGYSYYARRRIVNLEDAEALRRLWLASDPAWLIVERGRLGEARTVIGDAAPLVRRAVGSNEAWLFVNPAGRSVESGLVRYDAGGTR